jgi:hypothetical protein
MKRPRLPSISAVRGNEIIRALADHAVITAAALSTRRSDSRFTINAVVPMS